MFEEVHSGINGRGQNYYSSVLLRSAAYWCLALGKSGHDT